MIKTDLKQKETSNNMDRQGEKGSAIVISLFILALISVFVALALSRSSAEAAATGNETSEGRTFYAAQGSLETMTRNFNKVFEVKLNPTTADLNSVRNGTVAGLGTYTFFQELDQISASRNETLNGGPFTGLYAIRDTWRLRTTATSNNGTTANPIGTQVQLTRNVLNNRIPIFQFGIFYNDDLELFRPPRFSFGGRVHSNGNFFISPGAEGVYFDSRVTAADQIITQTWRNWEQSDIANNQTFIKNASGTFVQLTPTMGSVLNTTEGAANNIFQYPPAVPVPAQTPNLDLPPSRLNTSFLSQSAVFDGNLQSQVPLLKLPLNVGTDTDLAEMLRRGKEVASVTGGDLSSDGSTVAPVTAATADNGILRSERFSNKTGIRISLADSKAKLPGCASGVGITAIAGACGVRLDGAIDGSGPIPTPSPVATLERSRGYQPESMKKLAADTTFTYTATRANGERLHTGGSREVWIKVETVQTNVATGAIVTRDITQDILSLGVTEAAPASITITSPGYTGTPAVNGTATSPSPNITATTSQLASTFPDSRSIIKIQRFTMDGGSPQIPSTSNVLYSWGSGSYTYVVRRFSTTDDTKIAAGCTAGCTVRNADPNSSLENFGHLKRATLNGTTNEAIVPFPIEMFDMREGFYYDQRSTAYYSDLSKVTRSGVMSMVDIDVANLRRFLRGDFNGLFPIDTPFAVSNGGAGLMNSHIPQENGWVVYVSDRRGDADFDGEYDMEDVYGNSLGSGGPNTGGMQLGEDVNRSGFLEAKYMDPNSATACVLAGTNCEAPKYADTTAPDLAAVDDHKYYRRGVRLINGTTVPGIYDSATPSNTRGFTFATENGVYVEGNYNATGATTPPALGNTPYNQYQPFNTATHIPASIVADSVTILSNAWDDGESFSSPVISPYDQTNRIASTTQMRFAMIAGDTIASKEATPHQGGISPRLNGGVHNFKRYLERWTGQRLDYSGSLINLFNSQNNNGSFKCCDTVYNPPIRNWVFDSTFLDPARLPPGTPFFQYVQTTGFLRTND